MAGNFTARLAQAKLATKNNIADYDDKFKNLHEKVTSSKTKHVEAIKKLTDLTKQMQKYQKKFIIIS